jgi:hypothetical protein
VTVNHAAEDRILGGERHTGGLWTHLGKLVVRRLKADGTLMTVTLPDALATVDLEALEARVAALEAKQTPQPQP